MTDAVIRQDGRTYEQMRAITVERNPFGYAVASVYISLGNTKLLCAVTLQTGVPVFLRGKAQGWLTAEYNVLPTATQVRSARSGAAQTNGRSIEISRIIGRSLRSAVDLSRIQDMTLLVDCDVLQADGCTRTAAISGSYLALCFAQETLMTQQIITSPYILHEIAAVSVAVGEFGPLLDPTYQEDSTCHGDINFILSRSGGIIEVQGGAERGILPESSFFDAYRLAQLGVKNWFSLYDTVLNTGLASQPVACGLGAEHTEG